MNGQEEGPRSVAALPGALQVPSLGGGRRERKRAGWRVNALEELRRDGAAGPTVVNSRAELEALLRERPIQLRAWRKPLPVRPGHPDFVGPVDPAMLNRDGGIRYEADGNAYFEMLPRIAKYTDWKRRWAK